MITIWTENTKDLKKISMLMYTKQRLVKLELLHHTKILKMEVLNIFYV